VSSLSLENETAVRAKSVDVTDETITVRLNDGRSISVPTEWYPRLVHATPTERANYEIDGYGVSWPDVEADFSIRGILLGHKSGESRASLDFWLRHRRKGEKVTVEDFLKRRRSRRVSLAPANIRTEKYHAWLKENGRKVQHTGKQKQRKTL
jgi:uncharacterized protein DUF2442